MTANAFREAVRPAAVIQRPNDDDAKRARRRASGPSELDETGAVALSEDALALRFARQASTRFRFSPGMGWLVNRDTHWVHDDKLERFDAARTLCRMAAIQADDAREGKRLSSAKTVAAVITLAQADPSIVLPASAWDADPFALNTGEELIDLRTGRELPRAAHYLTQVTQVPRSTQACPVWLSFLRSVFLDDDEMIEFLQRLLGYLLTADRSEQKLFFLYGLGANGKSTLIDLIKWILGTYAIKLPASVLMQSSIDRHPTELAQLRGKRVAVSSELDEGQFWAESRIKELTGDEILTARFMRQDFFEFAMTQTHVIVGNYKPRLRGGDAALARRFVLVPFLAKFEGSARDPNMLTRLRGEAPAILGWMVEGAVKWCETGLQIPDSVTSASKDYLADNDDVSLWLAECCEIEPDSRTKAKDLYESFGYWIKGRGQHVPSMRLFGDRMSVLPGITKLQSNGIRYVGIRLTPEEASRIANSFS